MLHACRAAATHLMHRQRERQRQPQWHSVAGRQGDPWQRQSQPWRRARCRRCRPTHSSICRCWLGGHKGAHECPCLTGQERHAAHPCKQAGSRPDGEPPPHGPLVPADRGCSQPAYGTNTTLCSFSKARMQRHIGACLVLTCLAPHLPAPPCRTVNRHQSSSMATSGWRSSIGWASRPRISLAQAQRPAQDSRKEAGSMSADVWGAAGCRRRSEGVSYGGITCQLTALASHVQTPGLPGVSDVAGRATPGGTIIRAQLSAKCPSSLRRSPMPALRAASAYAAMM